MNILEQDLPKWPQMYTTGLPVTEDQAFEIIRRTDMFFTLPHLGSDYSFAPHLRSMLGIPDDYDQIKEWCYKWGQLKLEYVFNDWISCSFIFGPHGWCHPNGDIGFVDNVGKWPSMPSLHADWVDIAKSFPFLDVGVTLMDGEAVEEDTFPVASLRVKNGQVLTIDPDREDVHKDHPRATRSPWALEDNEKDFQRQLLATRSDLLEGERGLPQEWINRYRSIALSKGLV